MPDMCCLGCPAVPEPDETTCLFCLTPYDEEELQTIEEQADRFYQNMVNS